MTKTITGLFADQRGVEAAVRFLTTEYGIPSDEILLQPASNKPHRGSTQLTVNVNDDEVAEISAALATIGAALEARR